MSGLENLGAENFLLRDFLGDENDFLGEEKFFLGGGRCRWKKFFGGEGVGVDGKIFKAKFYIIFRPFFV